MARPGPKWDGKLYKPARWGGGLERGTVEWEQVQRQRRGDQAYIRRIIADRQADRKRPSEAWYLKSYLFVLYRAMAWLVRRVVR